MRLSPIILGLLSFGHLTLAQKSGFTTTESSTATRTTTSTQTATKTASGSARSATHTVTVGKNGFSFEPNTTTADVGDIIEFVFFPPDHSVIRGDLDNPCIPYEMTGSKRVGFYSGVKLMDSIPDDPLIFRVRVNNTSPIAYYCGATNSCNNEQMVGIINPPNKNAINKFAADAAKVENPLIPGESFPSESGGDNAGDVASGNNNNADNSGNGNDSGNGNSTSSGSLHATAGQIVGIAVGAASGVVLVSGLLYFLFRRGLFGCGGRKTKGKGARVSTLSTTTAELATPVSNVAPGLAGSAFMKQSPLPSPRYYPASVSNVSVDTLSHHRAPFHDSPYPPPPPPQGPYPSHYSHSYSGSQEHIASLQTKPYAATPPSHYAAPLAPPIPRAPVAPVAPVELPGPSVELPGHPTNQAPYTHYHNYP